MICICRDEEMTTLNDICSLITDGSHFSPEDEGAGYPMLSVKDMDDDHFNTSDCKHVGETAFQKLVANGCKPQVNDVVVAKDGSYLKTAFSIKEEQDIALLSSIAILRPKLDMVVPDYLSYFLKSDSVYRTVSLNYISGTALKRIILKGIKKIPVELPPIKEQQFRINLLNSLQVIIKQRGQELQKLDDLIKARFVELFMGKDYPLIALDELALGKGEYGAQSASIEYDPSRPRYVRITDINDDGTLNDDVVSSSNISDDEQYRLSYGDFLFARMGATVGKTYAYKGGNQIYAGYLIRYRLNLEKVMPEYLYAYTKLDEYKNWVVLNQSGAAQPGINAKKYGSLQIPVAPLEEQKAFEDFCKQVDKSKVAAQKALDEAQLLFDSLMQKYFG